MTFLQVLLATCLGAFIGRLMGMVVYYLPLILLEGCDKGREPRDIFKWFFQKPFCWSCKHSLSTVDGLPILGYFSSKGECYHCQFSFKRMFILELSIALLFGVMTLFSSFSLLLFFVLLVTCLLVCCFITDFDYTILPDQLTLTLVWVGLIGSLFPMFLSPKEAIIGAVGGYAIFWLLNEIYRYFRHRDGMYPGDFKLNAGVGACIGIDLLLPVLAIALVLLVVVSLAQVMIANKDSKESFLHKQVSYGCYLSIVSIATLFLLFYDKESI